MPQAKKYLTANTSYPHPHLGKMVADVLKQQGKSKLELARLLGISQSSVMQYFKQHSIQFSILWNIGIALQYDFLALLCNHYPPSMPRNEKSALVQENMELKLKLDDAEKTCSIYKELLMK